MAGPRNKRGPKADNLAAARAVAEVVRASVGLGEHALGAETAEGDVISPPLLPSVEAAPNAGQLSAPEKEGEAEARKLKELNAMLLKEVYERRGQVASLSARVEELSIAAINEDAVAEPEVEETLAGEAEKKQAVKTKKKKKAPARPVQASKAAAEAEVEKISTAKADATADEQGGMAAKEPEAAPAPGGRPRRNRKANSMYPADTWAR